MILYGNRFLKLLIESRFNFQIIFATNTFEETIENRIDQRIIIVYVKYINIKDKTKSL